MHGTDYGTNDLVDQAECDTFHTPHAWSETVPTEVAACADADGDLVHDVVDNCPADHNPD